MTDHTPAAQPRQDDITARLRENADLDAAEDGNPAVIRMEREAADEIDKLRALLSKLRAPVADEREALEKWMVVDGDMREPDGLITHHAAEFREGVSIGRAALASAPGADDAYTDVNAAMAAEYLRWIDYYHQGRDYDSFLKECVYNGEPGHEPAPVDTSSGCSAPVAGEANSTSWQDAFRISELPEVDEVLSNFANDSTGDNAVGLVQAILNAAPQASEAVREALQQSFDMGKFYGSLPEVDTVEVRNAALEEAATECESWLMTKTHSDLGNMANQTMERMARLIRALKTQPQVDKGGAENTVDGKGFSGFANSENAAQSGGAETGYNSPESRANPRDTVVLPPLPNTPYTSKGLYRDHWVWRDWQVIEWGRAAVLADRQQRAGDDIAKGLQEAAISLETISQRAGNSGGDKTDIRLFAASRARIARAALSAQPGAQKEKNDE